LKVIETSISITKINNRRSPALDINKDEQDVIIHHARNVLIAQSKSLVSLSELLDVGYYKAVKLINECVGNVIVTGIGKAGLIGQKISSTFASIGICSHFVHAGEALHGDLGRINKNDVVVVLSNSGETYEVIKLASYVVNNNIPLISITSKPTSSVAKLSSALICLGPLAESCSLGVSPSTSTTAMVVVGDSIAYVCGVLRNVTIDDFIKLHPSGNLGEKYCKVTDKMRNISECRVSVDNLTVRDVLVSCFKPGRRTGAIMLTSSAQHDEGELTGIFTDSDLTKILESRMECYLDKPIHLVMTDNPISIRNDSFMHEALSIMSRCKISELPVVDFNHVPVGIIDIVDVYS